MQMNQEKKRIIGMAPDRVCKQSLMMIWSRLEKKFENRLVQLFCEDLTKNKQMIEFYSQLPEEQLSIYVDFFFEDNPEKVDQSFIPTKQSRINSYSKNGENIKRNQKSQFLKVEKQEHEPKYSQYSEHSGYGKSDQRKNREKLEWEMEEEREPKYSQYSEHSGYGKSGQRKNREKLEWEMEEEREPKYSQYSEHSGYGKSGQRKNREKLEWEMEEEREPKYSQYSEHSGYGKSGQRKNREKLEWEMEEEREPKYSQYSEHSGYGKSGQRKNREKLEWEMEEEREPKYSQYSEYSGYQGYGRQSQRENRDLYDGSNQLREKESNLAKKRQASNELTKNPEDQVVCFISRVMSHLEDYSEFTGFSGRDLEKFQGFYMEYKKFPILQEHSIRQEINYAGRSYDEKSLMKQLQIVNSALHLSTDRHQLRITQVFAIYCFLLGMRKDKTLLQILTGEGKSTTIACLAGILTMRGIFVDIITTNEILAKRDVDEKKRFFRILGIDVQHNFSSDPKERLKPKKCYEKNNIVYGTPHTYQVDILYDQYRKKSTRNHRPYSAAIIDQVDSMFVDEKGHQTLLSTQYTGFSELITPMRVLFKTVATSNAVVENKELFLFMKTGKDQYTQAKAKEIMKVVVDDTRKKFGNEIIPSWRLKFVEMSLENWAWSALHALHVYKRNTHYTIQNGQIIPIDYQNTGCLQKSVQWENGLHQFLQMKHGLQVTTEGMTSNFISNLAHFGKYQKIYGLTGTLGSLESKLFLKQTYQVELFEVPSYHQRHLAIDPGFLMYGFEEWIKKIVERLEKLLQEKRSILIICESIDDANSIYQAVGSRGLKTSRIQLLTTGEEKYNDNVGCQELFIATNIAGRGTDLKAKEDLIQHGGLHTIIAFMPNNLRVEMQGRGRAGRNGAPGSSEVIVNYSKYIDENNLGKESRENFQAQNYEKAMTVFSKQVRDSLEKDRMKEDRQTVKSLRLKDEIFKLYCNATDKIPGFQDDKAKRDAIEENWAMFLKKIQIQKMSPNQVKKQAQKITQQYVKGSENYYNPNHKIHLGIHQALNNENKEKAHKIFKQIQNEDTNLTNKIAGKLLEATTKINMDPTNQKNVQSQLKMIQERVPQMINQKKDVVKSVNLANQSIQNEQIRDYYEGQQERNNRQLRKSLEQDRGQRSDVDLKRIKDQQLIKNSENIEKKGQQVANSAEIKIWEKVEDHLQKQLNKYNELKEGQYIEFSYVPLTQIIDQTEGKQKDLENATENLAADGLVLLPKANKKKKKKPSFWKRVLVFCLGIAQIFIGAMILGASAGAASSFGTHMIIQGTKDCFNALFRPELCEDLKKYFSEKALSYSFALAMIGIQGIKQLGQMGRNGFKTLSEQGMSKAMKAAANTIKEGFKKLPFDYSGLCSKLIYQGISSKMNKGSKQAYQPEQLTKVVKKNGQKLKPIINQGVKQEQKLDLQADKIGKKFNKELETIIKQITRVQYEKTLSQMKKYNIPEKHTYILVKNAFLKSYSSNFDPSKRKNIYEKILHFFTKNLQKNNLAEGYIKEFGVDKQIQNAMKKIRSDENYDQVLKASESQFNNLVHKQVAKVHEKYLAIVNEKKNKINHIKNKIDRDLLTQTQRNNLIDEHNALVTSNKEEIQIFNSFVQQVQKIEKTSSYFKQFYSKGLLINGKKSQGMGMISGVHRYLKEALRNVELKNSDEEVTDCIETTAYNIYSGIAIKAIQEVISQSSGSSAKLSEFEKNLNSILHR